MREKSRRRPNVACLQFLPIFERMNSKGLLLLFFISVNAFASEPNWLGRYLKSKTIRCDMTLDQLRSQVAAQIDFNIRQLDQNLKSRGSEIEAILQQRDQIEIGTFPKSQVFDFYVREAVAVVIQKLNFLVQTTDYSDEAAGPRVEKGLWFPLTITDPGRESLAL